MKLFDKPNWLKPEVNEPKYYLHLAIIALVVLGILQLTQGGDMLNVSSVLWSMVLLLLGDMVAHTALKMD